MCDNNNDNIKTTFNDSNNEEDIKWGDYGYDSGIKQEETDWSKVPTEWGDGGYEVVVK